jgi:hypothetical protein
MESFGDGSAFTIRDAGRITVGLDGLRIVIDGGKDLRFPLTCDAKVSYEEGTSVVTTVVPHEATVGAQGDYDSFGGTAAPSRARRRCSRRWRCGARHRRRARPPQRAPRRAPRTATFGFR